MSSLKKESTMKIDLDDIVASLTGGIYTVPNETSTRFNLHEMDKYCRSKNIEPYQLSKEERESFIVKK